jgi:hypothetical protein
VLCNIPLEFWPRLSGLDQDLFIKSLRTLGILRKFPKMLFNECGYFEKISENAYFHKNIFNYNETNVMIKLESFPMNGHVGIF